MKKFINRLFIVVFFLLAALWMVTKTDSFQRKATSFASSWLSEKTGCDVSVAKVGGYFPFFISLSTLTIQHQESKKILSTIDQLDFSPLWVDLPFNSLSFLYLGASGISLSDELFDEIGKSHSDSPFLQLPSSHLFHFSLGGIQIPEKYSKPLLNQWFQGIDVEIEYSLSGRFGYNRDKKSVYTSCHAQVSCKDLSPIQIDATLERDQEKTLLSYTIDISNPPEASVFINTFFDNSSLTGTLEGKDLSSGLKGAWQMMGSLREQHTPLSKQWLLGSKGTVDISTSEFHFVANSFTCLQNIPKLRLGTDTDLEFSETPVASFDVISIPIQGELQGTGSFETIPYKICLKSHDFSVNGIAPGINLAKLTTELHIDPSGIGDCFFEALLQHEMKALKPALKIALKCDWNVAKNQEFSIDNIALQIDDLPLEGFLRGSLYPFSLQGNLTSKDADISKIAQFFGLQPCGKAHLNISLSSEHTAYPTLNIGFECSKLEGQDIAFEKMVFLSSIPITQGAQSTFSFFAEGTRKETRFRVKNAGTFEKNIHDIRTLLTLKTMEIAFGEHEGKNEEPIVIELKNGLTIQPFSMRFKNDSSLYGSFECSKEHMYGSLTLQNTPLEFLSLFCPKMEISGPCCGKMELLGTPSAPLISCRISSEEFQMYNQMLRAFCLIDFQDNICKGSLNVESITQEGSSIHSTAHLPLSLSLYPFHYQFLSQEAFTLECSGTIIPPEDLEMVNGQLQIEGKACGTFENPQFHGSGKWQNGHLFIPVIGSRFENIEIEAILEKDRLVITKCSGTDGETGSFFGNGWIQPSWSTLSYELSAHFSNFYLISLDDLQIHSDAALTIEGDLHHATLRGIASVKDAFIPLSTQMANDLPLIDVVYVNQGEEIEKETFEFTTDIDILIPKTGRVTGMGFDSVWDGAIHLTTKDTSLFLHGALKACQASLEVANKPFQVTTADIDFQGTLAESKLHIIASNEIGPVITQILIRGSLESPKIDFQSIPTLSQKEVLSWIFFSKSSTEISPLEGIQLAQIILKLQRSPTQNFDIIEKIKNTLHIDRIDVNSANRSVPTNTLGNEVSLQVGKNISEGIVVTLSKDVSNEANRVGVEVNIADHFIATANVGDDAQAQLSIEWKVNY